MQVERHPDAASFLARAGAFLAEREALNNLLLGIANSLRMYPTRYPGPNYWAVVHDGGRLVGAALMTSPHGMQFSLPQGAAIDAVVRDLAAGGWALPGINGTVAASDEFAQKWRAARGVRVDVHMNLRAFELTQVVDPPSPGGRMRLAESGDDATVAKWFRDFYGEADIHSGGMSPEENARRGVREGRVFLWDDGGPVAQTVLSGTTPNGARIGGVYTPPTNRRRGYATALVAAVSRAQLAAGRTFCFLFTDLSNPTSNSIYPKIGYRAFADFREYEFDAS